MASVALVAALNLWGDDNKRNLGRI
ncbi:hypothetical protein CNECB9_2200009 [Cupriavidus necator]|uniref:Uncharacterized protein n=1 Tax=Cupriavidus necator TaxID=106590 RepID=A0A1K0JIG9_CUPNE|nr:hypothetical protein CNECB9_2200009 [Cupriavidus necator]